jgi:hypothetical protein
MGDGVLPPCAGKETVQRLEDIRVLILFGACTSRVISNNCPLIAVQFLSRLTPIENKRLSPCATQNSL